MSEIGADEFCRLSRIVCDESAIVLEAGKEYLVEARIGPILRREGLGSYGELVARIEARDGAALRAAVVDAMTTNETSFFRDGHPWEALREHLLPALAEARRSTRRLTFWCAAASSGQEPYSLAMLLHEHFAHVLATYEVRILATDLSPSTLERAESGRFSQLEVNRGLPATHLMRYFSRVGTEWKVADSLRSLIEFRVGNLIDAGDWARVPTVDAVFMRNVLIYFDTATRGEIVDRVHARLRPDGFLLLGSAETTVGACAYERVQFQRTSVFVPLPAVNPEPPRRVEATRPALAPGR
ncbi:MAG TPA: protein-glutamate O-methyltransferase CheR [Ilumatobacter sp.]|nr:protein-glutamate O-methyltransferase CheR [Ilumatobacter sp.]